MRGVLLACAFLALGIGSAVVSNPSASLLWVEQKSEDVGLYVLEAMGVDTWRSTGVKVETLEEGHGAKPLAAQKVTIHAVGYVRDGMRKFWNTKDEGQVPFSWYVGTRMMRGLNVGVQYMRLGEKARVTMTGEYGYGSEGYPSFGIEPNADLVYDLELVAIEE